MHHLQQLLDKALPTDLPILPPLDATHAHTCTQVTQRRRVVFDSTPTHPSFNCASST
jgi:hypothetical protein